MQEGFFCSKRYASPNYAGRLLCLSTCTWWKSPLSSKHDAYSLDFWNFIPDAYVKYLGSRAEWRNSWNRECMAVSFLLCFEPLTRLAVVGFWFTRSASGARFPLSPCYCYKKVAQRSLDTSCTVWLSSFCKIGTKLSQCGFSLFRCSGSKIQSLQGEWLSIITARITHAKALPFSCMGQFSTVNVLSEVSIEVRNGQKKNSLSTDVECTLLPCSCAANWKPSRI